ncbi:ATP-dependent RNA helicase RhlE [Arcobacter sp. 15-2]|uniref:DEAD/DEAH box helicase n=1 Tax=Arcobacter sp. 15-2 TaxID=3374109 RepID=UPI00399CA907
MSFTNLGLSKPILKAIEDQGYTSPSPIQAQAIPLVLEGKDVLAGAQTGTGKTAGFTLPILELMMHKSLKRQKLKTRALILTPTRELAAQVHQNVVDYSKYLPFTSAVIFGGVGINPQKAKLKNGVDILVATPGRLLDLIGQDALDLSNVEFFVLDEADRMLDMGFIHDIKKVLKMLPSDKQSLLFSATFSTSIKKLADSLLDSPTLIEVAKRNTSAQTISQKVHFVDKGRKKELLVHLIKRDNWHQVLVFTRTKHGANKLTQHLEIEGIKAAAIHGNKSQGARTKALADFKANAIQVLVATDIAARGIDIDQLPHVINFELPNVPEDYVHRIGRTGRAGNEGVALSLVCVDEHEFLNDIEKLIKKDIEKEEIPGYEVDPTIKPEPKKKQGGNRGRGGRGNGGGQGRRNNGQSTRNNSRNSRGRA